MSDIHSGSERLEDRRTDHAGRLKYLERLAEASEARPAEERKANEARLAEEGGIFDRSRRPGNRHSMMYWNRRGNR